MECDIEQHNNQKSYTTDFNGVHQHFHDLATAWDIKISCFYILL